MTWRPALIAAVLALSASTASGGVAVEGTDRARIVPPTGVPIEAYRDAGYSLTLRDDEAEVRIEAWPLGPGRYHFVSSTGPVTLPRVPGVSV